MFCHECLISGVERSAVGLCRFCLVGLCKDHLVAAYHSTVQPQYTCDHHPERPVVAAAPDAARRLTAVR